MPLGLLTGRSRNRSRAPVHHYPALYPPTAPSLMARPPNGRRSRSRLRAAERGPALEFPRFQPTLVPILSIMTFVPKNKTPVFQWARFTSSPSDAHLSARSIGKAAAGLASEAGCLFVQVSACLPNCYRTSNKCRCRARKSFNSASILPSFLPCTTVRTCLLDRLESERMTVSM